MSRTLMVQGQEPWGWWWRGLLWGTWEPGAELEGSCEQAYRCLGSQQQRSSLATCSSFWQGCSPAVAQEGELMGEPPPPGAKELCGGHSYSAHANGQPVPERSRNAWTTPTHSHPPLIPTTTRAASQRCLKQVGHGDQARASGGNRAETGTPSG